MWKIAAEILLGAFSYHEKKWPRGVVQNFRRSRKRLQLQRLRFCGSRVVVVAFLALLSKLSSTRTAAELSVVWRKTGPRIVDSPRNQACRTEKRCYFCQADISQKIKGQSCQKSSTCQNLWIENQNHHGFGCYSRDSRQVGFSLNCGSSSRANQSMTLNITTLLTAWLTE